MLFWLLLSLELVIKCMFCNIWEIEITDSSAFLICDPIKCRQKCVYLQSLITDCIHQWVVSRSTKGKFLPVNFSECQKTKHINICWNTTHQIYGVTHWVTPTPRLGTTDLGEPLTLPIPSWLTVIFSENHALKKHFFMITDCCACEFWSSPEAREGKFSLTCSCRKERGKK